MKFLPLDAPSFVLAALSAIAAFSASYGITQSEIQKHAHRLNTIETNVNNNENLLIEIRNDVKWLRLQVSNRINGG